MHFVRAAASFVPWEPCSENICLRMHTAPLGCLSLSPSCAPQPFGLLRTSNAPAHCHPSSGLRIAATWAGQRRNPEEFSVRQDRRAEPSLIYTVSNWKNSSAVKMERPKDGGSGVLSNVISSSDVNFETPFDEKKIKLQNQIELQKMIIGFPTKN